ncbi:MAG: hypothetical protein LBD97_04870 [Bifidobacteriaceae bacterium]|jgi:Tfp pilus assembly protein PilX|nr:hypothetical protein [Bifidobacteriaceae bacterium]
MEPDLMAGVTLPRSSRPPVPARSGEAGITMVVVLVAAVVIMVTVLGTFAFLSQSIKYSRHQQDTDLALAAAQSGLSDLLAQLRGDPTYLSEVSDPSDPYCRDEATGGPEGDYFAEPCGWNDSTAVQWESIGDRQEYHFAITTYSPITEQVEVLSTGRAGDVVRSLKGYVGREASDKWLYFTDYELADPTDYTTYRTWTNDPAESVYGPNQLTSQGCGGGYSLGTQAGGTNELGYKWQMSPTSPVRRTYVNKGLSFECAVPDFVAGDVIDGPVHSNDTIRSSGAKFTDRFSTFDPKCQGAQAADPATWNRCVDGTADFGVMPTYRDGPLQLPSTDDPREAATQGGRGCLYQGPTRIVFDGTKMRVWSRHTVTNRPGCGTPAALASSGGVEVDIPADDLIYVDVAGSGVAHTMIPSGAIGDGLQLGTYTGAAAGPGVKYTYEKAMTLPSKQDGIGNLFVEGSFSASVTVAAHGSVVITGDLVAEDPATNLLGVISGGSIEIYNPIMVSHTSTPSGGRYIWSTAAELGRDPTWTQNHDYDGDTTVLRIDAAMYAETAGFGLQNWKEGGPLGTLKLYGSIAQRFRGIVGYHDDQTGALYSGYRKEYTYNESLTKSSPLLFSPIKNGTWVITWVERTDAPPALR